MVYNYIKKSKPFLPRGMVGKHHTKASKLKMSKSKSKLFKQGKIIAWNKGLTLRHEKYVSQYKRVKGKINAIPIGHAVWTAQKENLPYVPKCFEIHHINFNQKNNNPNNLFLISIKDHRKYHAEIANALRNGGAY